MPIKNATVTCLGDSGTGKLVKWDYDSILRGYMKCTPCYQL